MSLMNFKKFIFRLINKYVKKIYTHIVTIYTSKKIMHKILFYDFLLQKTANLRHSIDRE